MAGYPRRTDLLGVPKKKVPIKTAKSKKYGDAAASRASQKAVPMATAPAPTAPVAARRELPTVSPLSGPSDRPNEPITAGVNFGPGPNAAQAGMPLGPSATNDARENLIYLNNKFPNSDLANLISTLFPEG